MTTYQDPPLQSRRAVRQGERPEGQPSSPFTPPQVPRTAAGAGEPLSYVTQNRPPLPAYDQAPPRGRRAAEGDETADQGDGAQPQPQQGFRPRDYSPEARTAPPAWSPEHDRGGLVEYHTQGRADVTPPVEAAGPAETASPEPAPSAPASSSSGPSAPARSSLAASLLGEPSEQTLTRRELRALREANGIVPADTVITPVVRDPRPQAPAADQQEAPAAPAAEAFPTRRGRRALEPRADTPDGEQPSPLAATPLSPEPAAQPQAVSLPPGPAAFPFSEPGAPAPEQAAPPQFATPSAAVAPVAAERPVGHWTTQSDLDDRTQISETTISRRIGTGALTTNALVLPSLPGHDMSTGEVMMTGTVALPAALSETGAHSAIDESDIDHLLDPGDHQLVHTDSVPISAFKAVSSHSGNRQQLIAKGKPDRGNRALTVLIASASGMVVVVVTLLVVALGTDVI